MNSDRSRRAFGFSPVSVLLVAGALGLIASNASAQSYFFNRSDFATAANSFRVLAADFNEDGKPDVLTVNATCPGPGNLCPGTISVLLGKTDGTFAPHVDYPVGNGPVAAALGDFNGDGQLDVAVVNQQDNTISVLLGNGDGTFQPQMAYATGSEPSGIVGGDFNGDGKLDIAVINLAAYTVSVLLGNGDGTFQPHVDSPAPAQPSSVVAGDFNGDGKLDLVVAGTTLSFMAGNGTGTFEAPTEIGGGGITVFLQADLNDDGKLDLVTYTSGGTSLDVRLGNGDGTFQPASPNTVPVGRGSVLSAAVGDVNGDGKLDIVASTSNGLALAYLVLLIGNGDGTFQPSVSYGTPSFNNLVLADFNGDDKLDVAGVYANEPELTVVLGDGDGTFYASTTLVQFAELVGSGDFTNEGKLDLLVGGGDTLLGNGDGTFQAPISNGIPNAGPPTASGDFNGDQKLDIAVINLNGAQIYLGNGDGTFQQPTATNPVGGGPIAIVAADFNGDGKLDLAVANNQSNTVSVLLGNGDGTFRPHVDYATAETPWWIAVGDFNGDGKLDLAVAVYTGVSVLLGNGDGTFQPHVDYGLSLGSKSVAAADFNGDGKLDLVAANESLPTGSVSVLLGNGDGTFQSPVSYPTFGGNTSILAADMNGDGKVDLVVGAYTLFGNLGTGVSILAGNGDGTFQSPVSTYLFGGVGLASDLNGDGALDLIDSTVSLLLNTPTVALFPSNLTFPGQGVGTTSPPLTLTISDPGSMPLSISGITSSGGVFSATNNCGSAVAVGANCAVSVTFSPTSTGTSTGTLTINDNAPGSPQVIALSGTGVTGPFAELSPASLSFGFVSMGGTASTKTVTLTNSGNAALSITSIGITGAGASAYQETNTCGSTLAAGSSCAIMVSFPQGTASGLQLASLSISDNATGSPQIVSLSATGVSPVLTFAPTSLTFATQNLGTTSAAQTLTLSNAGIASAIPIISVTGTDPQDFSETNMCPSLAPGASCSVSVTFTPTASGSRTASVCVIVDAALGSCSGAPVASAALTGTGAPAPLVSFSPSSLSFATQEVGTSSPIAKVTLTNKGTAALSITGVSAGGDFSLPTTPINPCKGSIAVGASCSISVIFQPRVTGALTGSLSVSDNAAASPQRLALTGTGTEPTVALAPGSVAFTAELAGQSGSARAVTLTNSGGAPLAISGVSFSGTDADDFSQQNNCGSSLAAGAGCTINVTFKPVAGGTRSAAMNIIDNAPGSPQTVAITATGNDFTLGVLSGSSGSATVTAGEAGKFKLSAGSLGTLMGSVSLACSGVPPQGMCSVTPSSASVSPGVESQPIVVTVGTTAPSGVAVPGGWSGRWPRLPLSGRWPFSIGWLTGFVLLALFAALTGLCRARRNDVMAASGLLLALALILGSLAVACGGGGPTTTTTQTGTPSGNYTVTVTGTYTSGSVMVQHNVSLKLNVQ